MPFARMLLIFCAMGNLLACMAHARSAGDELDERANRLLQKLPFCEVAARFDIAPEIVAGVFIVENILRRGMIDSAQDAIFRLLLDSRDDIWWDLWGKQAMQAADNAEDIRVLSNKWPLSVSSSGIAFSIGPAQITPRTALSSCAHFENKPMPCQRGVKFTIRQLLGDTGSVEIAGMVLSYERDVHRAATRRDVVENAGAWATLYNVGGGYYRQTLVSQQDPLPINSFGRWVVLNAEKIREHLSCSKTRG